MSGLHIEDESPPFAIAVRQMRFMSCQLFVEEGQGPAEITVDADVGVDDFIDFYFIDIEVDDLRVRREIFDVASDAVIESGADGDQEVAFRDGHIGSVRAMHADHAKVSVIRIGDAALAHEGRDDRDMHLLDDVFQAVRHVGKDDAATGEDDRALCLFNGFDGAVDIGFIADVMALVAAQMDFFGIFKFKRCIEYILGNIDKDRPGPACGCDVKGFFQDPGQFLDVLH